MDNTLAGLSLGLRASCVPVTLCDAGQNTQQGNDRMRRRLTWPSEEAKWLIDIWPDEHVSEMLDITRENSPVNKIVNEQIWERAF